MESFSDIADERDELEDELEEDDDDEAEDEDDDEGRAASLALEAAGRDVGSPNAEAGIAEPKRLEATGLLRSSRIFLSSV